MREQEMEENTSKNAPSSSPKAKEEVVASDSTTRTGSTKFFVQKSPLNETDERKDDVIDHLAEEDRATAEAMRAEGLSSVEHIVPEEVAKLYAAEADYTDPIVDHKRNKVLKRVTLVLVSVVALFFLGWFLYSNFLSHDERAQPPKTINKPTPTSTIITSDSLKPLLQQYKGAPKVGAGEMTVKTSKNSITDGVHSILISGVALTPPQEECKVTQPTDFCYAGRTSSGLEIYYLKDAVHSRLFESPKNFKKVTVKGSPSAGTMEIALGDSPSKAVAITTVSSSGWAFVGGGTSNAISDIYSKAVIAKVR